jgi:hypothetical protein
MAHTRRPHARAPVVYPSVSWHLRMCRSLRSPSLTYHKRHHQKRNLLRYSWWFLRAQQLRTHRLRSNNQRTMTHKTAPTKNTLPQAIPKTRRCTKMLTRWSPSGLNLRFSPVDFELCWSTWASPPLPGIGSRKSRIQGE